ncbi:hypothetical protein SNE40_016014 [Patella caerulea]|uniref:Integrase catalytic domain-containing protein n=1 Tax=Patella caerulea TaxID=87958 RepID=A0AAN8PCF0_PATCE
MASKGETHDTTETAMKTTDPSDMTERGRKSQLGKARVAFTSAIDNITKFMADGEENIEKLSGADLAKTLVELNAYVTEVSDTFSRIESLILAGETVPEKDQMLYDQTVQHILSYKRKLRVREDIKYSERSETLSHTTKQSGRSDTSSKRSERRRAAILEATLAEMKVKAEQIKQNAELARLKRDESRRQMDLQHQQYVKNVDLQTELASARIKVRVENTEDDQLGTLEQGASALIQSVQLGPTTYPPTLNNVLDTTTEQPPTSNPSDQVTTQQPQPSNNADGNPKQQLLTNSHHYNTNNELSTYHEVEALGKIMARTTLPPLKPIVFNGNKMMYQKWRSSFRVCFEKRTNDPEELLGYLADYTTGEAFYLIESTLHMQTMPNFEKAMKKLDDEYGNPVAICEAYVKKLEAWPKIKTADAKALRSFANFLENCSESLKGLGYTGKLNDVTVIKNALELLPWGMKNKFREDIQYLRDQRTEPTFDIFVNFVKKRAKALGDPVFGECSTTNTEKFHRPFTDLKKQPARAFGNSVKGYEQSTDNIATKKHIPRCLYCRSDHWLEHCSELRQKPISERREFLQKRDMCPRCTFRGHDAKDCPNTDWKICQICNRKGHITLFHTENDTRKEDNRLNPSALPFRQSHGRVNMTINPDDIPDEEFSDLAHLNLGYIRHISKPSDLTEIYIYSDAEADTCFLEEEFSFEKRWTGQSTTMNLTTMQGTCRIESQKICGLEILDHEMKESFLLPPCYTRTTLPIERSQIPTKAAALSFPHLRHIADEIPQKTESKIVLMIGRNVPLAVSPREVIPPAGPTSPWAEKSGLGWSILYAQKPTNRVCNFISVRSPTTDDEGESSLIIAESESSKDLSTKEFLKLMEQDFIENVPDEPSISKEDKKFEDIVDNSIHMVDGHYSIDLPFRSDPPGLEDNRTVAFKALERLEKRFVREPDFRHDYIKFMEDMIKSGYLGKIPENSSIKKSHYLTHHGVRHKKKKKIRVVFNASLKYMGKSLNDELYQGPDMLTNLTGALCRMRKGRIALTCDISSMFMMVKIPYKQRDYVRILWWKDGDSSKPPTHYHICYHLFGAVSSPSCSIRALQQTAYDNEKDFPAEVKNFILHDFYMDDGTTSVDSLDEASELALGAIDMCSRGGFDLCKFSSNSKDLLQRLPPEKRTPEVNDTFDFELDDLPHQRTLGMIWNTESDSFQYHVDMPKSILTRRGCLSSLSSVFDPMGLISPVMLPGRMILQEACKLKLAWDESLPDKMQEDWLKWRTNLEDLKHLSIPRCYKPTDFEDTVSSELHLFSDASTYGYGGCAYLRLKNSSGQIEVSLVMGKSRVVPIKPITVPRLELTSAVTMTKVAKLLKRELRIPDLQEFFWTDNTCVLGYLRSETKRFKTFVSHRVQKIQDYTNVNQWHHVATKENPGDIASRGIKPDKIIGSIWLSGPDFLWKNDEFWQHNDHQNIFEINTDDPELKAKTAKVLATREVDTENRTILDILENFSTLHKARKIVAVWIHFIRVLKSRWHGAQINPAYQKTAICLEEAEHEIIRLLQVEHFQTELTYLGNTQQDMNRSAVKKSSQLFRLNPFIDNKGLLRVGGRIKHAMLSFNEKHPIILPKRGHLTTLVIRHYHIKLFHSGRNMTLNAIRERFWLINGPSIVRHYISKCVNCKKLRGRSAEQIMSDLPDDRVQRGAPFTYSACDLFGPFMVQFKRSKLKRYGLIFSCQASRAVHLEVLHSMTTDSFINGLRRFICRRGSVKQIRSDCGSQILGSEIELNKAKREINEIIVKDQILYNFDCDITFVHTVPYAPHTHGSWERQINSVRRVLEGLLLQHGTNLTDESLLTFMVEAEAIVNSRPLTVESISDPEIKPLSPSNLLTMKNDIVLPPPGNFVQQDLYLHKQWRRAQYVINEFWTRWKTEVLQLLQQRQKWQYPKRNFQEGDIVLMIENDTPRNCWPLMIIEKTYRSKDNKIRKVDVATTRHQHGCRRRIKYTRAIQQLVMLIPVDD